MALQFAQDRYTIIISMKPLRPFKVTLISTLSSINGHRLLVILSRSEGSLVLDGQAILDHLKVVGRLDAKDALTPAISSPVMKKFANAKPANISACQR